MSGARGHRLLPHTADVRIESWAPTRDAAVEEAVCALAEVYGRPAPSATTREVSRRVEPADDEDLLVAALEEAVYLLDATSLAAVAARVVPRSDGVELVYDVSHNLAKLEHHAVAGERRLLCVHRKGATRAFPPGHPDLPADLAEHGQPVLVPGSMGTASYVLRGVAGGAAFHSACHGAGRRLSRHAAARRVRGGALREQLQAAGVCVRARSDRGLVEEAPVAYKDVDEVVEVCERAGLAGVVARLRPIGVVKG